MEAELERVEFQKFPKIPRLNRGMTITEKVDGTNACVIVELAETVVTNPQNPESSYWNLPIAKPVIDGVEYALFAQSRKRMITPGKATDNYGFAQWVVDNAEDLVKLGPGRHYGEWWGNGIQRGYGLQNGDKRFSLFNPYRYEAQIDGGVLPANVSTVPILEEGPFDTGRINTVLNYLATAGSQLAPFGDPEGIIVYHEAARQSFKVTLEDDESPKGKSR